MHACCWCWPTKDGLPAPGKDWSQVSFMIRLVSHSRVNLSNKTCTCRGSSVETVQSTSFRIHDVFDHALSFIQKQLFAQASMIVQIHPNFHFSQCLVHRQCLTMDDQKFASLSQQENLNQMGTHRIATYRKLSASQTHVLLCRLPCP